MAIVSDGIDNNKTKIQGIYKIRNCINGKVYIGQSIDIESRFWSHKSNVKKNYTHPLYNSMKCYGIENFEFIIIEEIEDVNSLDEREQYWMDYYKCYDRNLGYNLRPKAESTKGYKTSDETKLKISLANKGRVMSNENKLKLSKVNKGKKRSDESKLKMSLSHKGQKAWNKGKKYSEETKRKLSEIVKLQWQNPEYRDKLVLLHKERWQNPEIKAKYININKGRKFSDESKLKKSLAMKLKWQDPNFINKMKSLNKVTPERRQKLSDKAKKQWECPEIRNKMILRRKVI